MAQYAKYISETEIQMPTEQDFPSVPNYMTNDAALRRKEFVPLTDVPEDREGYRTVLDRFRFTKRTKTRVEPRNEDPVTHDPFMEDIYKEDPETHEMVNVGKHQVMRDVPVEFDDSYITVLDSHYEPIPTPEPPDTSLRDNAEKAIVGRIMQLVMTYHAEDELADILPDISIPALLQLAAEKRVTDADLQAVKSDVAILVLDLMAKEGGDWSSCWEGLKGRFPRWVEELNSQNA